MKKTLLAAAALFIIINVSAQHSLQKLWQTDTLLKAPESVRYDPAAKLLYVSNMGIFDKENTGFISKVSLDGKIIKKDWITGLNATKGLALYNNLLYAAELTDVAVIDITQGSIIQRIAIPGAQMLNDITIDSKGIVYVSDTRTGKVHKIENGKAEPYLDNMKDVNGLLSVGSDLYLLTGTTMQKMDAGRRIVTITTGIEGGADGIEQVNEDDFIITGWQGTVYYVTAGGIKETLLDTRDKKINAADLWYDPATKIAYIPAMLSNQVIAYQLK